MKAIKITDLEEFALDHIVRPYQTIGGFGDKRISAVPCSLEKLCDMLNQDVAWAKMVMYRMSRIKFKVPGYVKHPLADIIRESQK